MKIIVCVRQGTDGELSPFDACAYEEALKIEDAEITLLSMGPPAVSDLLLRLTRLGAKKAILLSDTAFAGADTLATAYTLSLAIKKLSPDLIFCGRQTLVGDTAQVGPMLSVFAETSLITNVMAIKSVDGVITCDTRSEGEKSAKLPALLTIERINNLRLPSITSKVGEVEVWSAKDIDANISKCGLSGSPTRVIETTENTSGRRRCKFISASELNSVIESALKKPLKETEAEISENKLNKVLCITAKPYGYAKTVSDNVVFCETLKVDGVISAIKAEKPDAVLFGSDDTSKRTAALAAAKLKSGLCADCTKLSTDGETLYMIRPALSGSVMAKIKSLSAPAMATVRTTQTAGNIIVAAGFGVRDSLEGVKAFANNLGAALAASRKAVDNDILPYKYQVGLTGKTVSPAVYIAIGISGAVHHIVGMDKAGTVIAVNPDKNANVFDYADYGIVDKFENIVGGIL